MSSVAKLKDKARDYERKEDWSKAVDAYLQVIQATEKGDGEAELSLYNRVGDLYLRLGRPSDAVDYYSKAADHYGEAGLYNNAIALCNKALRYQPDRVELYRKLGKLSAEQGFITDARRWYLEYAEKLARQGKKDEAFDALKEFATLSEDPEIREMLAAQLQQRGETAEAVNQLRLAWTQYTAGGAAPKAEEVRKRILGLDPRLEGTDLTLTADSATSNRGDDLPGIFIDSPPATTGPATTETIGVDEGYGFGEPAPVASTGAAPLPGFDEPPPAADLEPTALAGLESTDMGASAHEVLAADLPMLDMNRGASLVDEPEPAEATPLPTLDEGVGLETLPDAADAAPLSGLEDIGLESAEFEPPTEVESSSAFDLPMLEGELAPVEALEDSAGVLPTFDLGEPPADEDWGDDESEPLPELPGFDDEPAPEPLPTFADLDTGVGAAAIEEAGGADIDEWGDFPGDQQNVASLTEAGASAEPPPAAQPEMPLAAEPEPEPVDFEHARVAADLAAALPEPVVEAPIPEEPVEPEPFEPEPFEPEPVAAAPAPSEIDVDALIASARARFDTGERREALASLEAQHANLADANRVGDAYRVAEALVALDPDAVPSHQARVEYAFRLDDRSRLVAAYLDFAACLRRTGAEAKAESVFNRVLEIDPQNATARAATAKPEAPKLPAAPPADDFIDLGGLLRDDEEETTRFVVAETVESGDEERDFADMLSQFRAKIAQHVPQEDTDSHYDLGIAFKEMGLIDEAISEFQIALRGGKENLKVYEELGSCFMQKEQYNIAAKLLARGAQLPANDDSELLGVYYLLGRCYEELGQNNDAKEAYERVLGLDIDFRDVNERLARL